MRISYTLRKVLTLHSILVAILPLALIGAIAVQIFSRSIEHEIATRNVEIARALSGEIDRFLAEPLRVLTLANDRYVFRRKTGQTTPPADFLLLLQRRFDVFERLELVDLQGRIRYIAPSQQERLNTDLSGQPFLGDALAINSVVFSETFTSPKTGLPTIAIALPGQDSVAVGYLNLAALKGITDKIIIGAGGYAVVFDRLGHVIAHPEQEFVAERMNLKNIEPVRRAFAGETGTFSYSFRNKKSIGSTAIIYRTGWVVLVCQPEEDAFAAVAKIKKILLASVAATALLALFLAFTVLKKPLRSISSLIAAARKIAGGDYRIEDVPASYPEIDLLTGGFKGMVEEIAKREDALIKTEERYRNLVEESFDGIFIQKGAKIVLTNRRFCEMLGYEEKQLVGMEHWLIYHPEYQELTRTRALARLQGEDVTPRYEVKLLRRDGSSFDGEISARVVKVEGEPGIQVWVRDISEQKRAEKQRDLSERRFSELYNSVSDLIFTEDLQGRFLSVNKAMSDLFGFTQDEFIGLTPADFMKPEMAPFFETEYLGKMRDLGRYQGITAYFSKDKRKIYLDYRSVLIRPTEGEPFISGIARDVTERVLSDRALREKEENIRAVLEATPNPVVAYDTLGNVRFINPAFTGLFGWTLEELQGKRIPFVPDDQREKTEKPIRELYSGKEPGPITMETTRFTKDGTILDIFVSAALIIGSGGKPAGMVVAFTDITQKKKMEANLQQAQKMEAIGVLAGGIAHDFNNLLMGIQGNASLLLLDIKPGHPFYERLKHIEEFVSHGAHLTSRLLGFARGGKYEVKICNLNKIVAEVIKLYGATKKEIRITETLGRNLCSVEVDRSQIEQVLMNLFVNASQAMPAGGDLFVETENVSFNQDFIAGFAVKPGEYVKVSVTDTGIGMDEETRKRIFDPFFTTKETGKGSGLGLASVYGIIKNHGGFINVYSEKGKGSTFNFYLPAAGSGKAEESSEPDEKDRLIVGKGTILLVDDEKMMIDVGKEMLEVLGYTVITAQSGQEAIEKFTLAQTGKGNLGKIDLVIQDMIMPVMSGDAVFNRLKKIDPDVVVLLSSGYSVYGKAKEMLSHGCNGFIQKPFTMEELSMKVHEMMNKKTA
jgi:PAS domain S-box-containing protein